MAAAVETMFYVRETPWHGLGQRVESAPTSSDAIVMSGLNWTVESQRMFLGDGTQIPNAFANVRSSDNKVLGVVGERYKIVQNADAFVFTDNLIGEGCVYETAGSLHDGRRVWLLAHLPEAVQIAGDDVMPYLCFTNTHDGTGAVRVFMTPIRVVCNNTLNQALSTAKRTWSTRHVGDLQYKLENATETLQLANNYMTELKTASEALALKKIDRDQLVKFINLLLPENEDMTDRAKQNVHDIKNDIWIRYHYAPDLKDREQTMLRFLHAVSDTATHREPGRKTALWRENQFIDLVEGNKLIDNAYQICLAA